MRVHDMYECWFHGVMLMDDTVIFATSRERLCEKLNVLAQWCNKSGMVLNEDKTQFMAIGAETCDKVPIVLHLHHGTVYAKHCSEYKYLGAIITSDGKVSTSMAKHSSSKEKDMNKLTIFLQRNKNAPYAVKKVVVDACFNSSLLYSCESWLGAKPSGTLNSMYMKAVKMLLGVRQSTPNDTCLIEAGYPTLEAVVRQRQKKFLENMIADRSNMDDDPLMFALKITEKACYRNQTTLSREACQQSNHELCHHHKRKQSLTERSTLIYRSTQCTTVT